MKTVRVITGKAKGHKLKVPHKARPITDRMKSSLFSVLANDVKNKRILDLFAGSGALGIEALSRGAKYCKFVDISRYAKIDIENNLEKTGLEDKAKVTRQKVTPFLHNQEDEDFDIVFTDPPYDFYKHGAQRVSHHINDIIPLVSVGGGIILKHPSDIEEFNVNECLKKADRRDFGKNSITIWVKMKEISY
jgi:16S rRNA (guanine(966)-N(2))-methyltransferase RsmD